MVEPVLSIHDLGVTYGTTTVLSGLDLSLARGESVAVMGPSGSGKSSLLACVTGIMLPTHGRVEVVGQFVSEMKASARALLRRSVLGLVFQDPDLLPELTVEENVALTLLFDGCRRDRALDQARQALTDVGLSEHAGKRTDEISGGQAQRVALARALVRPEMSLLVADEPTASLDAANAHRMIDLLLERTRAVGAAAIIATHDMAVAEACDRVLMIRELAAEVAS